MAWGFAFVHEDDRGCRRASLSSGRNPYLWCPHTSTGIIRGIRPQSDMSTRTVSTHDSTTPRWRLQAWRHGGCAMPGCSLAHTIPAPTTSRSCSGTLRPRLCLGRPLTLLPEAQRQWHLLQCQPCHGRRAGRSLPVKHPGAKLATVRSHIHLHCILTEKPLGNRRPIANTGSEQRLEVDH